jgi:NADPH-dependent 2,4-dienoyl-CoA reductase/sulfur reductase-like enzyme
MTGGAVVIVGAGRAGVSAALALRQAGFKAAIRLYSDESEWPYDRPPLSKSLVENDIAPVSLLSEAEMTANALDIVRGARVLAIDTKARRLRTSTGEDSYDALILATGGTARALPSLPVDNDRVFSLRTYADARSIAAAVARAGRVAVVGGGWLGLEIAAAARTLGKHVTVFEAAAALCPRSLPPAVGDHLQRMHEAEGVRVATRSMATFARERTGIVARHAGETESFDIAIAAIGLVPQIALASEAGVACDDGILTDGAGRTSAAEVYAIGDAAKFHHDGLRLPLRLESWTNANVQGALVAQAICGGQPRHTAVPWFWSEQFGRIIQVAGLPQTDLELMSEDAGERPLWRFGREGRLAAVIGIDRARDVRAASTALSAQFAAASLRRELQTTATEDNPSTQAF